MRINRIKNLFKLTIYKILLLALITCGSSAEKSIFLIPQNFQGNILIIFDQKNGSPIEYEKTLRVYRIPESGVLRTQFSPNYGIREMDGFYFVSPDGQRAELKYFVNVLNKIEDKKDDDVICFNMETGVDNNNTRHFLVFSVAQVQNADSIVSQRSSFLWRALDEK